MLQLPSIRSDEYTSNKLSYVQQLLVLVPCRQLSLLYSTYLGATRVKPMGRPLLPAKPGTLIDGVCRAVHIEQKWCGPVQASPSGAIPGTDGVIRTLYLSAILSILGRSAAISSCTCTNFCFVVPRVFSANLSKVSSSLSFPILYSLVILTLPSPSINSWCRPFGPARFVKSSPRSTSST